MAIPSYSEGRRPSSRTLDGLRWTLMSRRRPRQKRTAKTCGPDAPLLASSCARLKRPGAAMVAKKPVHQGEHAISRKAIAQGRPGVHRCPVCSCAAYLVLTAHGTAGAARTRSSLRPLYERARKCLAKLGRIASRDREGAFAVIARSEATKQSSSPLCRTMDCFASLAMTARIVRPWEYGNWLTSLLCRIALLSQGQGRVIDSRGTISRDSRHRPVT